MHPPYHPTLPAVQYRRHSAFTLIELLVVIAIIAILAAILFPVFARARENARRTSCQSNMKQISLGWIQYVQDYDSKLPFYDYNGTMTQKVSPYIKNTQVWVCPSAPSPLYTIDQTGQGAHYGLPWCYANVKCAVVNLNDGGSVLGPDNMDQTSLMCLLGETTYDLNWNAACKGSAGTCYYSQYGYGYDRFTSWAPTSDYLHPDRHFDGSNYAFMDGHVKWLKKTDALADPATNNRIKFYQL